MRLFGLAPEKEYGVAESELTVHQRFEKASFGLNAEPVTLRLGSKDIQAARMGYTEPSGSTETTMDSETFQYIMYGLLGNYKHGWNSSLLNVHQFYAGENTKLPSFTADFVYDFARKQLTGVQVDEVKIDIKDDLITVATEWIYKNESGDLLKDKNGNLIYELEDQGLVSTAKYDQKTVDGIPYIGYDCEVTLKGPTEVGGDNIPVTINEMSMNFKVNHNREGSRGITSRVPVKKPSTQNREMEVSFTTTMDINTYKLMVAAEYGVAPSNLGSTWTPHACKFTTLGMTIKFQTCEQRAHFVWMEFPKLLMSADVLEVNSNDEIQLSFTLTPMGGSEALEYNKHTTHVTPLLVQVINGQPNILDPNEEPPASGTED